MFDMDHEHSVALRWLPLQGSFPLAMLCVVAGLVVRCAGLHSVWGFTRTASQSAFVVLFVFTTSGVLHGVALSEGMFIPRPVGLYSVRSFPLDR